MKVPTLQEEKKLWKKGYKRVAGLDEAGRGPLAGPVVACAVIIKNPKSKIRNPKQIPNSEFKYSKRVSNFVLRISDLKLRDSKKLTPKAREEFYKILTTQTGILWGIGAVSEKTIDRINILEATKLAMVKAVRKLKKPNYLILDGNFKIDSPIPQKSIVKADEKVFSCSCASIIAKVTRDRMMLKYDRKYPCYDFASNKGYPTKFHRAMLRKYGSSEIHRQTFTLV